MKSADMRRPLEFAFECELTELHRGKKLTLSICWVVADEEEQEMVREMFLFVLLVTGEIRSLAAVKLNVC